MHAAETDGNPFAKMLVYTNFLKNKTQTIFKQGNHDTALIKDVLTQSIRQLITGYTEVTSELSLELQRQSLNEVCVIFERVTFGLSFICNKLLASDRPVEHIEHSKHNSVPVLPQIGSPQGQFGGVSLSKMSLSNSKFYTSRYNESFETGSQTDRARPKGNRQLRLTLDKQTSTFNDFQDGVREVILHRQDREQRINDILENTVLNLQVLEEALQHKDDHHSVRNSTIHSELVRISDRMGGFKGDIESVIKTYRQEDMKNNEQEVLSLQSEMKDHIKDVQKSTADRIIQLFSSKVHKYQVMVRQQMADSPGLSATKIKKKGKQGKQGGDDCRCALYIKELVDNRARFDQLEAQIRQGKCDVADRDAEIVSLRTEVDFMRFKVEQQEEERQVQSKQLEELQKIGILKLFRNKEKKVTHSVVQTQDDRSFDDDTFNNETTEMQRERLQELTQCVIQSAAGFEREVAGHYVMQMAEMFRFKTKHDQYFTLKQMLQELQSHSPRSNTGDFTPMISRDNVLERSFAIEQNRMVASPQSYFAKYGTSENATDHRRLENLLSVPVQKSFALDRSSRNISRNISVVEDDVKKSTSDMPRSIREKLLGAEQAPRNGTEDQEIRAKQQSVYYSSPLLNPGMVNPTNKPRPSQFQSPQQLTPQTATQQMNSVQQPEQFYQPRPSQQYVPSELQATISPLTSPQQTPRQNTRSISQLDDLGFRSNTFIPQRSISQVSQEFGSPRVLAANQNQVASSYGNPGQSIANLGNQGTGSMVNIGTINLDNPVTGSVVQLSTTNLGNPVTGSMHSTTNLGNPSLSVLPRLSGSYGHIESHEGSLLLDQRYNTNLIRLKLGPYSVQTQTDYALLSPLLIELLKDQLPESQLTRIREAVAQKLAVCDSTHYDIDSTNPSIVQQLQPQTYANGQQAKASANGQQSPKAAPIPAWQLQQQNKASQQLQSNAPQMQSTQTRLGQPPGRSKPNSTKPPTIGHHQPNGRVLVRQVQDSSVQQVFEVTQFPLFQLASMPETMESQILQQLNDGTLNLSSVEDCPPEQLTQRLFASLMSGGNPELVNAIKKKGDVLTLEEFAEFIRKLKQHHVPCGKDCTHLARFYLRLGFILMRYYSKKKTLQLPKPALKPFN